MEASNVSRNAGIGAIGVAIGSTAGAVGLLGASTVALPRPKDNERAKQAARIEQTFDEVFGGERITNPWRGEGAAANARLDARLARADKLFNMGETSLKVSFAAALTGAFLIGASMIGE